MSNLPMIAPARSLITSINRSIKAAITSARIVSFMTPLWAFGTDAQYADRKFENFVKDGYRKNELIYSCIQKTANTAASVSLRVHDKKSGKELEDHPLRELLKHPNEIYTEYDFWTTSIVHMKLAGVSFWQKIRDKSGQVLSLWPIRPDYVRPHISNENGLDRFDIEINGVIVETIDADDMLRIPLPDPLEMFKVLSPIAVLGRSADVDNSLTDFMKMFIDRGAIPQGILSSKLKLNDDAITDIRRRWGERYAGYREAMIPAVLDSDASYQKIGLAFNEMVFNDLDGRNESRICMVLQVPPIIVGASIGLNRSTFSNYAEARKAWWEDDLLPLYARLASVINEQLLPDFEDNGVECRWDFTNIPALQEERTARWTRATAAFSSGVITRNMALEEMGLENVGAEGDVFINSASGTTPDNRNDNTAPGADDDAAADPEADTPEGEIEGKDGTPVADQTDEQRKWFFAHLDEIGVSTGTPRYKENDTPTDKADKIRTHIAVLRTKVSHPTARDYLDQADNRVYMAQRALRNAPSDSKEHYTRALDHAINMAHYNTAESRKTQQNSEKGLPMTADTKALTSADGTVTPADDAKPTITGKALPPAKPVTYSDEEKDKLFELFNHLKTAEKVGKEAVKA